VPTELPAAVDAALKQEPEVLALERAMSAATGVERVAILTEKKNLLEKLRREELESYRRDWLIQRRKEKILSHGRLAHCPERDTNPFNELIPEKGRLAVMMAGDPDIALADLQGAMEDMLFLLKEDRTALYRPGKRPKDGRCPECNEKPERSAEEHGLTRQAAADKLAGSKNGGDGVISTAAGDKPRQSAVPQALATSCTASSVRSGSRKVVSGTSTAFQN
jgi:hypothetical protein